MSRFSPRTILSCTVGLPSSKQGCHAHAFMHGLVSVLFLKHLINRHPVFLSLVTEFLSPPLAQVVRSRGQCEALSSCVANGMAYVMTMPGGLGSQEGSGQTCGHCCFRRTMMALRLMLVSLTANQCPY